MTQLRIAPGAPLQPKKQVCMHYAQQPPQWVAESLNHAAGGPVGQFVETVSRTSGASQELFLMRRGNAKPFLYRIILYTVYVPIYGIRTDKTIYVYKYMYIHSIYSSSAATFIYFLSCNEPSQQQ